MTESKEIIEFCKKKYGEANAKILIERINRYEKRLPDVVLSKAYYCLTFIAEKCNGTTELTSFLNSRLLLATLSCQHNTQACLIVCILRSYLISKNFTAAANFVETINFPENAHNNDVARFNYYQGRIKALQLEYASAARFFEQALKKAPQDSAIGFKQTVMKWVVVVSLLQGEIPERSIFRQEIHIYTLAPYLKLAQAVRCGNIVEFNKVLQECSDFFKVDETLTLIVRLRQNVIKTAIRQISLTYSRIYIKDIAIKLQFPTEAEAEYVVEKAIKDNTIKASIEYGQKSGLRYLLSAGAQNIYQTTGPQFKFDVRIRNCLELHNVAIKALRYPSDVKIEEMEPTEEQRDREILEMHLADELDGADEF